MGRADGIDWTTLELIRITELCEAFSVLPKEGGLLDQDPFLMRAITCVLAVKSEKAQQEQEKAKAQANAARRT